MASPEHFVRYLNNPELVQLNIAMGASVYWHRRGYQGVLAERWGQDWFSKIPMKLRPPTWLTNVHISKRMLKAMAANAKEGYSLNDATMAWQAALASRTDPRLRREHGMRSSNVTYLTPQDVNALNTTPVVGVKGRSGCADSLAEDAQEHQVHLASAPCGAGEQQPAADRAITPAQTVGRSKRKRTTGPPREIPAAEAHSRQHKPSTDRSTIAENAIKCEIRRTASGEDGETDLVDLTGESDSEDGPAAEEAAPAAVEALESVDEDTSEGQTETRGDDDEDAIVLVSKATELLEGLSSALQTLPTLTAFRDRKRDASDHCFQHQARLLQQIDAQLRPAMRRFEEGCRVSWATPVFELA
jgi:hypothetical protein